MKRLSLLLLLIIPVSSIAQTAPEPPDTVKLIDNPQKVIVSRTGDTTVIEVEKQTDCGKDLFTYNVTVEEADDSEPSFDLEIPFGIGKDREAHKCSPRLRTSVILVGHGYLGQRFNYFDKGNVKNSIEVGFREAVGIRWSRGVYGPSFSTGIGIGTQIYHAQDGFAYAKVGSSLVLLPVESGASVKSTQLYVLNFQIPLMLTVPIGREVKFTLGAVGCFNSYARAHTEISKDAVKIKTTYKGLQQRLFTAELTSSIGVCDILGVYASWSPMTLFQSPYGPRLKSWSLGAVINF
ncbi:MAG: hypothetical protein K2M16_02875 [Muribaculaceae bacterium]|nr:hypothetical protein [Muribaculaceae bacterium]